MDIIKVKGFTNYINQNTIKSKIVLHGTYGGTAEGAIAWLNGQAGKGVSVHYIIGQDAKIYQLFPEQKFSYHAGGNFRTISQTSFGIQIVNFLSLKYVQGKWRSWTNKVIPENRTIVTEPWRGCTHFHSITPEQHEAIQYLLKYLCQKYGIRKRFFRTYDPTAGFNTRDFTGILQHSSFHSSKLDFQPSIIPKISI